MKVVAVLPDIAQHHLEEARCPGMVRMPPLRILDLSIWSLRVQGVAASEIWPRASSPSIARSIAPMASLPAHPGANALHDEISPLRDRRVAVVTRSACCTDW